MKMNCVRSVRPGLSLLAVALVMFTLAAIGPAHAAHMSTSQKAYADWVKDDVKNVLPKTLAGMQLGEFMTGATGYRITYTGGKPLSQVVITGGSLGKDRANRYEAMLAKQAKAGKIKALTHEGHTIYVGIAVASEPPSLITILDGGMMLRISAQPKGIPEDTQDKAIKQQLLAVYDGFNPREVAGVFPNGLPISGHITVSGAIDMSTDLTTITPRLMHNAQAEGVVWSVHLHTAKDGVQIRLFHLPVDISTGTYELRERPNYGEIVSSEHPFEQPAVLLFVDKPDTSDDIEFQTWGEDLTGTLTIESIENHRMSGTFEFTAKLDAGGFGDAPSVTVKGEFKDVPVLNGQ